MTDMHWHRQHFCCNTQKQLACSWQCQGQVCNTCKLIDRPAAVQQSLDAPGSCSAGTCPPWPHPLQTPVLLADAAANLVQDCEGY